MIDLEALLGGTNDLPLCGPNLEHDLAFFELEEAARGKPEMRVGDAVKPAEDPKWDRVLELGQGLLLRSKDLRVATHVTRALVRTAGFPGLAQGLALIQGLLDRYWEHVHPQLEADADNDPTERLNALAPLADAETLIKDVRDTALVSAREQGQLQAREVEIALGRLASAGPASGGPARTLAQIHGQIAAAFATDRSAPDALRQAHASVTAIEGLLVDRVGAERALDLKPLAQVLESLIETCDVALGLRESTPSASAGADTGQTSGGMAFLADGQIRTRDEAVRALDLICKYLERQEPSHPAPLLIRRAQRLMTKNFVEIVRDLMPDSLSNLERLAGEALEQKQ
jgi:type VI secretion system protein ImpA